MREGVETREKKGNHRWQQLPLSSAQSFSLRAQVQSFSLRAQAQSQSLFSQSSHFSLGQGQQKTSKDTFSTAGSTV
jgi:hypothetical protein